MSKFQNFSLNDYIQVKLINNGLDILLDNYKKLPNYNFDLDTVLGIYKYNYGWITIQMWEFCNTFGKYLHMGNNKPPVEISNCRLEVK